MDSSVTRRTLLTGAAAGFGFAFTGSMEAFARPGRVVRCCVATTFTPSVVCHSRYSSPARSEIIGGHDGKRMD